jgi:hypothetical protein
MDVYRLPIHLRNFYYKELIDAKKKEVDNTKKSQKTNTPSTGPNIKVRK